MFSASMKFLMTCLRMLMLNYIIIPLGFITYQLVANKRPVVLILPYPGSYPECFTNDPIIFAGVFFLEAVNVVVGASISLGADCYFGLIVFQMSAILNIMSNRVLRAEANEELFVTLRECIDQHSQLMDFGHRLEPIYGLMILSQRLTDAVVLCAVIYQIHEVCTDELNLNGSTS
ncbi:uncharacterized protein [Fopius arisanus]|uniref:Uncharacterized protein n=1 Tax=Fopius arisanus TaxID=64838 RepID=A0A9R1TEH9_9HYME|nr:PREDICTED: uncharacterized protein LOC105269295 [Fopius arisanus]